MMKKKLMSMKDAQKLMSKDSTVQEWSAKRSQSVHVIKTEFAPVWDAEYQHGLNVESQHTSAIFDILNDAHNNDFGDIAESNAHSGNANSSTGWLDRPVSDWTEQDKNNIMQFSFDAAKRNNGGNNPSSKEVTKIAGGVMGHALLRDQARSYAKVMKTAAANPELQTGNALDLNELASNFNKLEPNGAIEYSANGGGNSGFDTIRRTSRAIQKSIQNYRNRRNIQRRRSVAETLCIALLSSRLGVPTATHVMDYAVSKSKKPVQPKRKNYDDGMSL